LDKKNPLTIGLEPSELAKEFKEEKAMLQKFVDP
jgi:sensor histidine kinase regulating citrate/malate metabolism